VTPRPRSNRRLFVLLLAAIALGACSSRKIEVSWEYDPQAKLSGLSTYAWVPGPQPETGDPRVDDPLIDRRVRTALDEALAEKGFSKSEPETADFWIGYHARLDDRVDTSTMRSYSGSLARAAGVGRERGWNVGGPPITYSRMYDVGSLNLYVVDTKSNRPVWHAVAVAEIRPKDSVEKRRERLREAARRMLEKFPP
jgi:hypothetical protein